MQVRRVDVVRQVFYHFQESISFMMHIALHAVKWTVNFKTTDCEILFAISGKSVVVTENVVVKNYTKTPFTVDFFLS